MSGIYNWDINLSPLLTLLLVPLVFCQTAQCREKSPIASTTDIVALSAGHYDNSAQVEEETKAGELRRRSTSPSRSNRRSKRIGSFGESTWMLMPPWHNLQDRIRHWMQCGR